MNINQETIKGLNAVVKVNISEADYKADLDKKIKEYQKKANLKGFRPGQVPIGMIKKMYGTSIKVEEINRVVVKGLYDYLIENKIEIFGEPMLKPVDEKIDWNDQTDFEFDYEIGLRPEIKITLDDIKADYYKIIADEAMVSKRLEEIQARFGEYIVVDEAGEKDMVDFELTEVDDNGNTFIGGIEHKGYCFVNRFEGTDFHKKILGIKKDEVINFSSDEIADKTVLSSMTGLKKDDLESVNKRFSIKIEKIESRKPAELNTDLYNKVFPGELIDNIDAFKAKLQEVSEKEFEGYSDGKFSADIIKNLVDNTTIELPDDFLKKMLLEMNDSKLTQEDIDKEYDNYTKSIKDQLVRDTILKDNGLSLTEKDVDDYIRDYVKNQFEMYGKFDYTDDEINTVLSNLKKNQKEINKIHEHLSDQKLILLLKEKVNKEEKNVTFEEFIKL
ncbi:MAG: trigger factor [Bacteroidota bacterium]|nr:trigger factor [Bacteroidota bacterium]